MAVSLHLRQQLATIARRPPKGPGAAASRTDRPYMTERLESRTSGDTTITAREVVPLLLKIGVLDSDVVVREGVVVVDMPRRNYNFRVECGSGPSFFVKHGVGLEGRRSVSAEAALYQRLTSSETSDEVKGLLPEAYALSDVPGTLILRYLSTATSMEVLPPWRGRLSVQVASRLGQALGAIHQQDVDATKRVLPPPWILGFHRPAVSLLTHASSAQIQLVRLVQSDSKIGSELDALFAAWNGNSLIHQDIKADNILVERPVLAGRKPTVKIVDWELGGTGDSRWDVGSVFADLLGFWVRGIPMVGATSIEANLPDASIPLERIQLFSTRFWSSYCRRRGLRGLDKTEFVRTCTRFAAARLVQTCYEWTQYRGELASDVTYLLQLAVNILKRPTEASVQLLGLPI
jgi:aminoglycoside phosphotransferase (APT) family kinase protein